MKLISIFILWCFCMDAQTDSNSVFYGRVVHYAKVRHDYSNAVIDTTANQARLIKIFPNENRMEICWDFEVSTEPEMYCVTYNIEKTYDSKMLNQTSGMMGYYKNYIVFDKDNYPVMLAFNEALDVVFLYYFWNAKETRFTKVEKVKLNKSIRDTKSL